MRNRRMTNVQSVKRALRIREREADRLKKQLKELKSFKAQFNEPVPLIVPSQALTSVKAEVLMFADVSNYKKGALRYLGGRMHIRVDGKLLDGILLR